MPLVLRRSLDKSLPALMGLAAEAEGFLVGAGAQAPILFKVLLALEETVRNLIEHGGESPTNRLEVCLEVGEGRAVLLIEDDGPPFDPRQAPAFDPSLPLEDRVPHGMGVALLRHFMTDIQYERLGSRNQLRLVVES